jgi:tubulin--tyrosine ligase
VSCFDLFQPLPNAFELFGVDFLVAHVPGSASYQVKLLEMNAEPAIEKTGARLTWILEDLFASIATVCVRPFLTGAVADNQWNLGETRHRLIKCLHEEVRAA